MNVLIVGLGSIAKKHIAALREIDAGINFYALRSSLHAQPYEGIKSVFSLAELEAVTVDFAIVSTPTAEHKATIEQLLPLRCPLFIEKPLAHTSGIGSLTDSIKDSGILTYVACNLRFLECIQYVKKKLQEKKVRINEVNAYCGSYLPDWRPGADFRKVYSAIPENGGGVHIDLIHEVDYIYWLFGRPERSHRVFRNRSSLDIPAYDYANYWLEYEDFCAGVILNYYRRDAKRSLEIVGEDMTWNIDLLKNQVFENERLIFSSDRTIRDTYKAQMGYFVDLVRNKNKKSFNTFFDALEVLQICLDDDIKR